MPEIDALPANTAITDDDLFVVLNAPAGAKEAQKATAAVAKTYFAGDAVTRVGGGKEAVVTSNTGTSYTIALASGNVFDLTVTGNVTFAFSGSTAGVACSCTVILRRDGTGSRTITWPASVKWLGTLPNWGVTASKVAGMASFTTVDNGTTWLGVAVGEEQ